MATGALASPGSVLLVSCYELGHQPFTVASPWAQLERAGFGVAGVDAAVEPLADETIERARLVAISVPMLTALRLGAAIARRVRAKNPGATILLYGLYAWLNASFALDGLADAVVGGEFESALVEVAGALDRGAPLEGLPGVTTARDHASGAPPAKPVLRRLPFEKPRRSGLPPLERYAKLLGPREGEERIAGYVEASRGCLHLCRHCPVTPVYEGRFFVVPREIVLADAEQQIEAGARHLSFGDPDFLNGPGHAMAVVRDLHAAHPDVTFDVTTKVEHMRRHGHLFSELAALGCVFVISAIESLSDRVLAALDKGHRRADVLPALAIVGDAGIALRPSFVPFTPWSTLDDVIELCDFVVGEGLVDHVDPIQLSLRLLIPPGSALLAGDEPRPWLGPLVPEELGHRWTHPDPAVDRLWGRVSRLVELAAAEGRDAGDTILAVRALAYETAGRAAPERATLVRRFVPKLTEPWFCCAEPNARQLEQVKAAATPDCCEDTCRR